MQAGLKHNSGLFLLTGNAFGIINSMRWLAQCNKGLIVHGRRSTAIKSADTNFLPCRTFDTTFQRFLFIGARLSSTILGADQRVAASTSHMICIIHDERSAYSSLNGLLLGFKQTDGFPAQQCRPPSPSGTLIQTFCPASILCRDLTLFQNS